ncbi:MAG TPA: DUF6600 domain-containing protein [Acidisarcina sp.]
MLTSKETTTAERSFPAATLVPALLACALVVAGWSGTAPAMAQSDDPPARVARLGQLEGQVSIQPSGVEQWSQASSNYPVATGDRIYADQDGRGEISAGEAVARIWHATDVTVTSLNDQLLQLGLAQGTLRVHTFTVDANNQVEVDTPNGAITVTQPGDIRVDTFTGDDGTIVTVNSGAVQLSGPDLQQELYAGNSVRLQGSNPIQISQNDIPRADQFDHWSLDRDRHMRDSQTSQYVNRDAVGSEDLDDYGDWSQSSDYGPVWYPRQVAVDWAPYREGHWVWTGPWGWTWVDDEPWGYAPFHYGRWVRVEDRWGWLPGPVQVRPIWSPALVAFVGGGGFSIGVGVSAWFPLGPGEPYHPWYHCSPSYQQRVNVTNVNITVIHNTTIINNYNGYLRNPQDSSHLDSVRYANREVAVTAMRQSDFASARPVHAAMVRVDPVELQRTQIMAHPMVRPTMQSLAPRPVSVPVPVQRPTLLTQGGREMQATTGARSQPVPYRAAPQNQIRGGSGYPSGPDPAYQNRTGPNAGTQNPAYLNGGSPANQNRTGPGAGTQSPVYQNEGANRGQNIYNRDTVNNGQVTAPARPIPPPPSQPAPAGIHSRPYYPGAQLNPAPPQQQQPQQPYAQSVRGQNYPQQHRPLVNRNEYPAPQPSFEQQQPALNQHPGRPLEPQQLQNLNQGRVAGPSRDAEYPPHAAQPYRPAPQERQPAAPSRPAREDKPAPKDKDRDKNPR